mmetsp:Transcript_62767/g.180584  ORF Transcript_62767/g.180584 Transcript_62767/m.180584 type:complete len:217 (+) Transcript_62767:118-768(+)
MQTSPLQLLATSPGGVCCPLVRHGAAKALAGLPVRACQPMEVHPMRLEMRGCGLAQTRERRSHRRLVQTLSSLRRALLVGHCAASSIGPPCVTPRLAKRHAARTPGAGGVVVAHHGRRRAYKPWRVRGGSRLVHALRHDDNNLARLLRQRRRLGNPRAEQRLRRRRVDALPGPPVVLLPGALCVLAFGVPLAMAHAPPNTPPIQALEASERVELQR